MVQSEFDAILRSILEITKIEPLEGLEWDSLAQLSLVMELEKISPGFSKEAPELLQIVNYNDFIDLAKQKKIIS
tara:strand:- start:156 stop:377 length:222 start_codon:yes stop_codon:yes gene_type:complete